MSTALAQRTEPLPLNYDDYCLLPNDGKIYQIIEGELFVSPSPITRHQRILLRLSHYLNAFVMKYNLGEILVAPYDIVLSQTNIVVPDIAFVSNERENIITEKNAQGAPYLIVEILSPSTQKLDRTLKLKQYARFGVQEYWIVDGRKNIIDVFTLSENTYQLNGRFAHNEKLVSPLLSDLQIPLKDIFV